MIDAEGRIVLVNREVERLFGYSREELLGRPVETLVPERFHAAHPGYRGAFAEHPAVRNMGVGRELFGRRKDGSEVPVEIGLTPLVTDEGFFVLSSIVDITARRKAEARFRAAVESSPAGMLMVDQSGRIVLVNREVERLFGYAREELLGRPVDLLVPERSRQAHPGFRDGFYHAPGDRAMGAGRELFGLRKDGTEVPVEIGLNPIETEEGLYVLSSIVDLSARREADQQRARLEAQLRHAQKMEAVGTLAGGIAHDFNNILGGILGYAELAIARSNGDPQRSELDEIIHAAGRGRDLVASILRFSRQREMVLAPVDLAQVIEDTLRLLRPTLPMTIEVRTAITVAPARALGDATAIEQVLMNLATNGAHAMPGGGVLGISLDPFTPDARWIDLHPQMAARALFRVQVRDTGHGMSEEVRLRAFEPFFTTKDTGAGTGLGLAMVHGIMTDHHGVVEIESTPGEGCTVRCYFPATGEPRPPAVATLDDAPNGRGERVLFLDDDPALARLGLYRLNDLGYAATSVTGVTEAIEGCLTGGYALLISDYMMPTMTGIQLARELVARGCAIPVIVLSGMALEIEDTDLRDTNVRRILGKPISLADLAHVVREVLDAEAGRTVGR